MPDNEHRTAQKLSAGVVVVHRDDGYRYLLLRAYQYWDFPKGKVEDREQPLDAACREVAEESGLTELEFAWGPGYIETPPYRGGKVARYYLALSRSNRVHLGINPVLGRAEHHEYRWLRYGEARPLLTTRVQHVLDWAESIIGSRGNP